MSEQCRPVRVAVIVECKLVANNQNVIPGVTFHGPNPNGSESAIGVGPEKRIRQDVAGAAREKDTFG